MESGKRNIIIITKKCQGLIETPNKFKWPFVSLFRTLDSFILCCYAKKAIKDLMCKSRVNEFSSCEDMMKNPAVRVCLWILGIIALVGNLLVIFWRLVHSEDSKVQSFLLKNLAFSDFLMGVYLIIIAVQDTRWQGEYFKHDVQWRAGTVCQVTGALSMLSSEVSWQSVQCFFFKVKCINVLPAPFSAHVKTRIPLHTSHSSGSVELRDCNVK